MTKNLKILLIILGVVVVGGLVALAFQSPGPVEEVVETEEPEVDESALEEEIVVGEPEMDEPVFEEEIAIDEEPIIGEKEESIADEESEEPVVDDPKEEKKEEKVSEFFELRLAPFFDASARCFGRDRFALDPPREEDAALKQEIDYIGEYLRKEVDVGIENFDYEEIKIAQKKIEDFYEFLIKFYPEDADCMNNHDDGREYDESDFFEI